MKVKKQTKQDHINYLEAALAGEQAAVRYHEKALKDYKESQEAQKLHMANQIIQSGASVVDSMTRAFLSLNKNL